MICVLLHKVTSVLCLLNTPPLRDRLPLQLGLHRRGREAWMCDFRQAIHLRTGSRIIFALIGLLLGKMETNWHGLESRVPSHLLQKKTY